jgi:hypothetical protein
MATMTTQIELPGVPPGHGVISTLRAEDGDFRLTWDPAKPDEVENARQAFRDLRASGHAMEAVEPGRRGRREIIRDFDPAAGALQVVAHRPLRGG